MATAQGVGGVSFQKAQDRIALGCLALNFVSPGLCPGKKKATAVVETTKEDSISCVLMRGQLSLVPSGTALVQYLSAELQVPACRAVDQCFCLLRSCPGSHLHLL